MDDFVLNPERPTPREIATTIGSLRVRYVGFDGQTHDGIMEIHEELVPDLRDFFEAAFALGFPIERVVRSSDAMFGWDDDKLMAANATSGFNYRLIKGTDRPSLHGLGRAFDVNCRVNPYIRYIDGEQIIDPPSATYDSSSPGALYANHPLVRIMKDRGWVWGGDWTAESGRTDYQHFEKKE